MLLLLLIFGSHNNHACSPKEPMLTVYCKLEPKGKRGTEIFVWRHKFLWLLHPSTLWFKSSVLKWQIPMGCFKCLLLSVCYQKCFCFWCSRVEAVSSETTVPIMHMDTLMSHTFHTKYPWQQNVHPSNNVHQSLWSALTTFLLFLG